MAERFRGTGHILRFIEYMDVGTTNGWRLDEVVPAAEIVAAVDQSWPLDPARAELPRRGRDPLPLPRRGRRDRRDRVRHSTVLRRLHQSATIRRRQALHLPIRRQRPRPSRTPPQRRHQPTTPHPHTVDMGQPRRPLLRAPARRQPTTPQGRDVLHRRLTPPGRNPARQSRRSGTRRTSTTRTATSASFGRS